MTMTSQSQTVQKQSTNRGTFWDSFVAKVHRVLSLGYQRLCNTKGAIALTSEDEPTITGFLVTCMKEMKDRVDWRLCIEDDPPLNDDGRTGRSRPRIDIQVTRVGRGVEPRFHFEAKRLYTNKSEDKYLEGDGLQALLTEYYAKGEPHAGMLGYVQQGTAHEWADKILKKLENNRQGYGLDPSEDCWQKRNDESNLEHSFSSHHPNCSRPITVHHIFLLCHG